MTPLLVENLATVVVAGILVGICLKVIAILVVNHSRNQAAFELAYERGDPAAAIRFYDLVVREHRQIDHQPGVFYWPIAAVFVLREWLGMQAGIVLIAMSGLIIVFIVSLLLSPLGVHLVDFPAFIIASGAGYWVGSSVVKRSVKPLARDDNEALARLISACPEFHLDTHPPLPNAKPKTLGHDQEIGELAAWLVDSAAKQRTHCFGPIFDDVEALLRQVRPDLRRLIRDGLLKQIQHVCSTRDIDSRLFLPFMGPLTRGGWFGLMAKVIQPRDLVKPVQKILRDHPGDWMDPEMVLTELQRKNRDIVDRVGQAVRTYGAPDLVDETWFVSVALGLVSDDDGFTVSHEHRIPEMKSKTSWIVARADK